MKTIKVAFVNVIITIVLAVIVSWSGLFTFCQLYYYHPFCWNGYNYATVAGGAITLVVALLLLQQYLAMAAVMHSKRTRPTPHVINRYVALEKTVKTIWNVWNPDDKLTKSIILDDLENVGWVVEYAGAYTIIVQEKAFYYWLLDVAKLQHQLETTGKWRNVSPLSQRQNSGVSYKRLSAYIKLLEDVDAIEYVNANVKRLKSSVAADVWMKVIKPLEAIKPVVKI